MIAYVYFTNVTNSPSGQTLLSMDVTVWSNSARSVFPSLVYDLSVYPPGALETKVLSDAVNSWNAANPSQPPVDIGVDEIVTVNFPNYEIRKFVVEAG